MYWHGLTVPLEYRVLETRTATRKAIVLIDDDHGPMDYFVQVLQLRGFEVTHYDSVTQALKFIRSSFSDAPDYFIVDIMMPPEAEFSMDDTDKGLWTGVHVIHEIRKNPRLAQSKILCLSNQPDMKEVQNKIGADIPFIGKYETSPSLLANLLMES